MRHRNYSRANGDFQAGPPANPPNKGIHTESRGTDGPVWEINDGASYTPEKDEDSYLRLLHIPVLVRDQNRSLRFYLEQLGFRLIADRSREHGRFILVAAPDGGAPLALIAPKPGSEEYKLIGQSGQQAVFVTEDVMARFEVWRARGVHFQGPPQTGAWGGMFARFEDIDGNKFILAGWDNFTREIERQRRALAKKLESERRAAQELAIAKEVQARLFPQTAPPLETLEYAGTCIQAREVGGDYYDFINLGRGRLGLVLGDISGKGIAAALLMANLQSNVRSQFAVAIDDPCQFLQSVNRLFYESTSESNYATVFFAEYTDRTRQLRFANCGHLPGLLLRSDRTLERLASTCPVLGIFKEWNCAIQERTLSSGETLLLYTDGVTELIDDLGEEFGEKRLVEVLIRHHELPTQALLETIVDEVRRFSTHEQTDDLTLIVAKCKKN